MATVKITKAVVKEKERKDETNARIERIHPFEFHTNQDYSFSERVHIYIKTCTKHGASYHAKPNIVLTLSIHYDVQTSNDDMDFKFRKALSQYPIDNMDEFIKAFAYRHFYK